MAGVGVVRHRRAQHEVRLPGRVQQPEPDATTYFNEIIAHPDEQRRAEPAHADHRLSTAANPKYVRNLLPTSFYAQDQWTAGRLTLQGGVRYDHLLTHVSRVEGRRPGLHGCRRPEIVYPVEVDPGDPLARRHAAVGRGLRPVRQRQDGPQVQPGQVHGSLRRRATRTSTSIRSSASPPARRGRGPTRTRISCRTAISSNPAKNGECGAMDESELRERECSPGRYDPGLTTGWGNRPYNWALGVSVQQEIVPRVSVNVGYFRNWWGNWYAVDNRATTVGGLHAVQHRGAGRSAAAGGGGQTISGLYNLVPDKVGQVDELAQHSDNFAAADRELAGGGRQRQRAAAERAHRAGRHEHRAPARGRLRAEGGAAGAGRQRQRFEYRDRRRLR